MAERQGSSGRQVSVQQVLQEDGSVFSIQWSVIPSPPGNRLAPGEVLADYLLFLRRVTGSLVRPLAVEGGVEFRLLGTRLSLLSFRGPLPGEESGVPRVALLICGGFLVQRAVCDRGELEIACEPVDGGTRVSLRLADYCPLLLGSRQPGPFRKWLYRLTQAAIHRVVTVRFLVWLFRSRVGSRVPHRVVKVRVAPGEEI